MDSAISGERFWLLELIAYWEGRLTTQHLCQTFGISRQQASKVISDYKTQHPDNLQYSASHKGYLPSPEFRPHLITGDATEYLNWLTAPYRKPSQRPETVPHLGLALPPRRIDPNLIRSLVKAVRENRRIDVGYVSLSHPDSEGRIIAPHSFVNTGLRWHLRAWCEKSGSFRDFVLSRFSGEADLLDKSRYSAADDVAWNTETTLIFEPDSRFSSAQRAVIENDYKMVAGQLRVDTRAALVHYLIQEMQVNTKFLSESPEAQQLVLVNKDDIREWLFDQ